jgi:hypothetical protein
MSALAPDDADDSSTAEPSMDYSALDTILSRVVKEMSSIFSSCVDKLITSMDQKLTLQLNIHEREIHAAATRLDHIEKSFVKLAAENDNLKAQIKTLQLQIDQSVNQLDKLDQYGRNENLVFHGLPHPTSENPDQLKSSVVDSLNFNFNSNVVAQEDISVVHRLGRKMQPTNSSIPLKPAPIIIRFVRREVRNNLLFNRKILKGKKLLLMSN